MQIEGRAQTVKIDQAVIPLEVAIAEPTTIDSRSDIIRVREALIHAGAKSSIDFLFRVLDDLSTSFRNNHWYLILAMRKYTIASVLPSLIPLLGLAVDVGTTKLAAYLSS